MTQNNYLGLGQILGSGGHGRVYESNNRLRAVKIIPIAQLPIAKSHPYGQITVVSCEYVGISKDKTLFEIRYSGLNEKVETYSFNDKEVRKLQMAAKEIGVLKRTMQNSISAGGRLIGYYSHKIVVDSDGHLAAAVEIDRVEGDCICETDVYQGLRLKLQICSELMEAIDELHELGYMHLDVKPNNVMMDRRGVVLVDYSAAQPINSNRVDDLEDLMLGEFNRLRQSRYFVGTPKYVAPEQARGTPCPMSDYYSSALVMLELLDQHPFPYLASFGAITIELYLTSNQLNPKKTAEIVFKIRRGELMADFPQLERNSFAEVIGKLMEPQFERRKNEDFKQVCGDLLKKNRGGEFSLSDFRTAEIDVDEEEMAELYVF